MLEEIMHDYDWDIEYDNNIWFYHDYLTLYLNQESVELLYTKWVRWCEQLYAIEEAWLDDCMRWDAKDLEYYIDMELLST